MHTFYVVRHAHADWANGEDRPLSSRGDIDAIRVADILQKYPISVIYSSPYRRACQTIIPLATRLDLPVLIEPDLRERQLSSGKVKYFFKAVEATWRDPLFTHPGGESNAAAQKRGLEVCKRLRKQHSEEHIVISTHGNLMALILQVFIPSVDYEFWKSLSLPDIYSITFNQAGEAATRRLWPETEP